MIHHLFRSYIFSVFLVLTAVFADSTIDGIFVDPYYYYASRDVSAFLADSMDTSELYQHPVGTFPDNWDNSGTFQYFFEIDTTLADAALALRIHLIGAMDVYLDGRQIADLGTVGHDIHSEKAILSRDIPFTIDLRFFSGQHFVNGLSEHSLVIRYSAHILDDPLGFGLPPGFHFDIGDRQEFHRERNELLRLVTTHQMLLLGIFSVVAVICLLLFIFYPKIRPNLYFSIFSAAWAILTFFRFQEFFYTDPDQYLFSLRMTHIFGVVFILSAIRIVYMLIFSVIPRTFWIALAIGLLIILFELRRPDLEANLLILFLAAGMIEIIRVTVLARAKKIILPYENSWLILWGFVPFAVISLIRMLTVFGIMEPLWDFIHFPALFYGMLFPAISMLIFVAVNFAHTNRNLEEQLAQVKQLSEQTLRNELEKARLESENERKTKELEKARQLQLAMLPTELPHVPGYDLAAFMETATEVGGDYYDFVHGKDGTLFFAFGDATGHGIQAGTVVTATKSLFQTLAYKGEPAHVLAAMSPSIKAMGLSHLYMALSIAKVVGNKITIAAAAMPFPLVYRADAHSIQAVELKGVPLGSFVNFQYDSATIELKNGDVLLFMSDGLPEMFNEEREQLDENRVRNAFLECANRSAQDIISHLVRLGSEWSGEEPQHDDVTFLVLKKSEM